MSLDIPGPTRHRAEYLHQHSVRVLDGDLKQTVNDTSFITALSHVIHGNELGANGCVRVQIRGRYFNDSGSLKTIQFRIQFGGTTMYIDNAGVVSSAAGARSLYIDFLLYNQNSTSSQNLGGVYILSNPGNASVGIGNIDTVAPDGFSSIGGADPAKDTTLNQTLEVRIHQFTTDVGVTLSVEYVSVELFRGP